MQNSERTVIKDDRLKKVAEAAVKQSQQAFIPKLNSLVDFKEFIKKDSSDVKLIAHCEKESKQHIKQYITTNKSFTVLIGPEGDFTKDEIALALSSTYLPVALGDSRLRTETAGLFACNALAVINS